jgi:pilus assembly protein CpaC
MRVRLTALATMATVLHAGAAAQEYVASGSRQTLDLERAVGRIEVDKEGVIDVSMAGARSVRVAGLKPGEARIKIFATDGALLREATFTVPDPARHGGEAPALSSSAEQVVAVDVQFAAVSTTTLRALGFNFTRLSGDLQGAVITPNSLNSASFGPNGLQISSSAPIQEAFNLFLSAPNRGIGAVLSALSSNGLSQMLAQPTLLARSGEEASFLAGGEVPIPVPGNFGGGNGNAVTIDYKQFGVRLSVTPMVLKDDRIVLRVAPEVSELDFGIGLQLQGFSVPGLRRRSAETTVELGAGQSFVIAGMSYSNANITKDKVPLLGDIPILGQLFRREQEAKEQQELIIVVTPRLVGPLEPDQLPPLPGVASGDAETSGRTPNFGVVRD